MKRLTFGLIAALGLALAGCQKSVESEMQDVREAEKDKMENVKEEQRDVQDAAIEGEKQVLEEKREVEDAKTNETGTGPPTTPATP